MASPYTIISSPDGAHSIALGLTWKRIVVSGSAAASEAAAYEHARQAGSNSLVFTRGSRGEVRAVGHAKLAAKDQGALSLAQALTQRHDHRNRYICAIRLPEDPGLAWVCAVAEGLVVNGFDVVVEVEDAQSRVRDFVAKFDLGTVSIYGDVDEEAEPLSIEDLVDIATEQIDICAFSPVKKNAAAQRKLLVIFLVLLGVVAAQYGYGHYKEYRRKRAEALAESLKKPSISAQQAWDRGLAAWVASSSQATPFALDQVLALVGQAPTELVGWELKTVDCNRAATTWGCVANYERIAETRATTQDFLRAMPKGWAADWGGMNKVAARFSGPAEAAPVVISSLQEAKALSLPLLGYLQNHSRAFTKAEVGAAASVPVDVPKQPDGTAIVIDYSTVKPAVVSMEVAINGPLRSMYKLKGQPVSWRVLKLALSTNTGDGPSVSRLNVTDARGDLYAVK